MTGFPGSPKLFRGGIVLLDPTEKKGGSSKGVIVLQYNPDTLTRTLQVQGVGDAGADRSEALRLKGPPVETIKLEAELDIADQLDSPFLTAFSAGLQPQLAALETLVYPTSEKLQADNQLALQGAFEIFPMETLLTVFVWSKARVLPVRLTEFSISEEAFDPDLNPIRAKVSLGMRVLTVMDLGFGHRGGGLFMTHLKQKEVWARANNLQLGINALGLTGAI